MLAHRPQILLVGISDWHRQFDAVIMHPTHTLWAVLLTRTTNDHLRRKGLNDENQISPASWEKLFSLDIALYRTRLIVFYGERRATYANKQQEPLTESN